MYKQKQKSTRGEEWKGAENKCWFTVCSLNEYAILTSDAKMKYDLIS